MYPLTLNPEVVIRVENGKVVAAATNIAPELAVTVTTNADQFNALGKGKAFKVTPTVGPQSDDAS